MGVQNVTRVSITPVSTPPPTSVPDFSRVIQDQTNWCWAACTVMVIGRYHLGPRRQCELANNLFSPQDKICCSQAASCNKGCPASQVAPVYQSQGISATRNTFSRPISPEVKTNILATIRQEITAGRPVELKFNLSLTSAHLVIVSAFDNPDGSADGFRYMVSDPDFTPGFLTGERLLLLDGKGDITDSWTGIQPI